MSKQQTALRLALEALKELVAQTETGLFAVRHDHVAMNDARQAITALREALANEALDRMAENAKKLGLDYEPAPVQQEPISLAGEGHELYQQLLEAGRELLRAVNEDEKWGCVGPGPTEIAWDKFSSLASHVCTGIDSPQPVQQEPVARPRGFYVFPQPAQRTWVGLTDEDWTEIENMPDTFDQGVAWAQARLKRNNT